MPAPAKKKSHHIKAKLWGVTAAILFGVFIFETIPSHASATGTAIRSGDNYCLDDYKGKTTPGNTVDAWHCNNSSAQDWTVSDTTISRIDGYCLSVKNDGTKQGSPIVLNKCSSAPGQIWLRDQGGYQNPNSGLCLSDPNNVSGAGLVLSTCANLSATSETWTPNKVTAPSCQNMAKGASVACYAIQEWTSWQAVSSSHATLLNNYTDGNSYEEWCADFVSYVYRESGHAFTQGERDNWDEYDANNVQNMGLTIHQASSGYQPQPGDIAYFDYDSGHVEIVVSGGKTPTFVYGDSASPDPQTGNGDMRANTITNDGTYGQVIYYMSLN